MVPTRQRFGPYDLAGLQVELWLQHYSEVDIGHQGAHQLNCAGRLIFAVLAWPDMSALQERAGDIHIDICTSQVEEQDFYTRTSGYSYMPFQGILLLCAVPYDNRQIRQYALPPKIQQQ